MVTIFLKQILKKLVIKSYRDVPCIVTSVLAASPKTLILEFFFPLCTDIRSPGSREDMEGGPAADPDKTHQPPPAKLLQDWSRTPLPHVCPYCGKTFTRRVFLRTHVYSHTGEKLFTCKVPLKIQSTFICSLGGGGVL